MLATLLASVAAVNGAASGPGSASGRTGYFGRGGNHYVVGLFGDQPYGATGKAEYPNVLADLNAHNLAFSVFDGDLKAGGDGAARTTYTPHRSGSSTRCERH